MILLDANVLIYAFDSGSRRHERVRPWLEAALSGEEEIGLPLVTALAFLRIVTNPATMREPMPSTEAIEVISTIAGRRNVRIVEPTSRHWDVLGGLVEAGRVKGPLFTDAHIATLALEHGATVATTDRDFARFPGVKILDPS